MLQNKFHLIVLLAVCFFGCTRAEPDKTTEEMLITSMNIVDQIIQNELDRLHSIAGMK